MKDFSFEFQSPSKYALLGPNGSGKSTLLQMLSGFLTPSGQGQITFHLREQLIEDKNRFQYVSLAAPYLELIEELSLSEFLNYHFQFKKNLLSPNEMLHEVGLQSSAHKLIRQFSSGMKQRVKLLQAIFSDTAVILLDEPCTNLDQEGVALYHRLIETYGKNRLIIVASNDPQEYQFCDTMLKLADYK